MLKRLIVNAVILLVLAELLSGVRMVGGASTIFLAAAALGIANALIRPLLLLITLPLNLLTLGLFTFVINALMIQLTSVLVPGFSLESFGWAFLAAVLFSVASVIISMILD